MSITNLDQKIKFHSMDLQGKSISKMKEDTNGNYVFPELTFPRSMQVNMHSAKDRVPF